jgi:integrase
MKRRGRGEGSVYERGDGTWTASISLGADANGKRKRKVLYAPTKGELLTKLRQTQHLADRGQLPESGALTVSEFLEMWLKDAAGSIAPTTHHYYAKHVRHHLTPRLGTMRLDKVNALVVRGLYSELASAEVSAANQRKIGVTLGVALGHAVSLKLIPHNPVSDVRKPKPAKFVGTCWTGQELRQFLESTKGTPHYALFLLAAETGARQGELLALRWVDVDFAGSAINIRHSLYKSEGQFILKEPKTAAGRRKIALSPTVVAALNEHRKTALASGFYGADRPVFCSVTGDYIYGTSFYNHVFIPAVKRAGVPVARFHDIRHACASLLLQDGIDLATVSARLGHGSKVTTLAIYAHALDNGQAKATAAMERIAIGGRS